TTLATSSQSMPVPKWPKQPVKIWTRFLSVGIPGGCWQQSPVTAFDLAGSDSRSLTVEKLSVFALVRSGSEHTHAANCHSSSQSEGIREWKANCQDTADTGLHTGGSRCGSKTCVTLSGDCVLPRVLPPRPSSPSALPLAGESLCSPW